ncbi:MAG: glycosyltransferase family 4 protein [Gemmatimonadota bacterium]|nr:glycosyltransferase family 4 protein [Gemmatimonadota bacterium]
MKPRVQVICGQPLPLGGVPSTGAGLRAWSFGEGLKAQGCDVVYSLPKDVVTHIPEPSEAIQKAAFDYHALEHAIERVDPSVVVLQGWTWANLLKEKPDIPVVVDLTGPYLVESLFSMVEDQRMMPFAKLQALQKADFVTCAGDVQRRYFLPWLLLAGHDIREDACPVIPMSLSPDLPTPRTPDEPVFLYSGIFLPWQDPSHALERVIEILDERQAGKLLIFAGPHPTYQFPTGNTPAVIERLRTHPRVEFIGVVPFETLTEHSLDCSVSIDLMARNVERELAFTTRTVVAMWCGLPVLYNDYSELSSYIDRYQAGWTVSPDDTAEIDLVLNSVFDKPDQIYTFGQHARRLVRDRLNWKKTVLPLAEFCHAPSKRVRGSSILDQTISPLDDRFCRLMVDVKHSSLYRSLKNLKNR